MNFGNILFAVFYAMILLSEELIYLPIDEHFLALN